MLRLSRSVPLLLPVALLAGCYLDHGLAARADAGPIPGPVDAALLPLDARPLPDAASACAPVRADFLCTDSFVLPAGRAFTLPLSFDTCGCCAETSCSITVDAASRTLRASTRLCPDPCDCIDCNTPVAQCEVPPLAAGEWTLEVNGAVATSLTVGTDRPAVPTCIDFAEPDDCSDRTTVLPGRVMSVARACVLPRFEGPEHGRVILTDDCGTCDREGPCEVRVEPRLTDDLPPGVDVRVRARRYAGACDGACPPLCMVTPRTCIFPPIEDGQLVRILPEGSRPIIYESGGLPMRCE